MLSTSAVSPPLEVTPAAVSAMFARHAGHMRLFRPLLLRLFGCLFQIISQAIERSFPEFAILFHPLRGLLERFGLELHLVHTPVAPATKQSCFLKDTQMF